MEKVIIECSECGKQLRIPADKYIKFICPSCKANLEAENGELVTDIDDFVDLDSNDISDVDFTDVNQTNDTTDSTDNTTDKNTTSSDNVVNSVNNSSFDDLKSTMPNIDDLLAGAGNNTMSTSTSITTKIVNGVSQTVKTTKTTKIVNGETVTTETTEIIN